MLLFATILPVSSQGIEYNKIPNVINENFGDSPFFLFTNK